MLRSEGFQCDPKLYRSTSVNRYKLIMLQLDDIAALLCDHICHSGQFTRLIRQKNRYGKDPVTQDQSLLYY